MKVKSLQEILKHLAARTKAPKRIRIMPDRYDPEPVLVFVDEVTDQRPSGSHSRAQKVVAALSISIVFAKFAVLEAQLAQLTCGLRPAPCRLTGVDLGLAQPLA